MERLLCAFAMVTALAALLISTTPAMSTFRRLVF